VSLTQFIDVNPCILNYFFIDGTRGKQSSSEIEAVLLPARLQDPVVDIMRQSGLVFFRGIACRWREILPHEDAGFMQRTRNQRRAGFVHPEYDVDHRSLLRLPAALAPEHGWLHAVVALLRHHA
jgi:hypothetical protein